MTVPSRPFRRSGRQDCLDRLARRSPGIMRGRAAARMAERPGMVFWQGGQHMNRHLKAAA